MNHPFRHTSFLAAVALCACSSPLLGAGPAAAAPQGATESPVAVAEAQRDLWLAEAPLALGGNPDGSWVGSGVAEIAVRPGPTWGPARIAAFRRAEAEARASFVEHQGVEVTLESFERLFEDRPDRKGWLESVPDRGDRIAEIERRLASLEESDLARALELVGLTPEQLARLSEGERRKALEESFRSRIATRATAHLSGLRVIQTFEGKVGDRFAVCVLVRWCEENAKLAEILRTGKGTIAPAEQGRPVEAWIPKDDGLLIHDYGVRVFPGPEGVPLILVFQQSPVTTGPQDDARVREIKRRTALARARTAALGDLTLFVDGTTASEQWLEQGEGLTASQRLFPDGLGALEPGSGALSQALTLAIDSRGSAVIHGGTVVRSWTADHPDTGTTFCGVVYAWSPTRARLALGTSGGGAGGAKGPGQARDDDYPVDF